MGGLRGASATYSGTSNPIFSFTAKKKFEK